METPLRQKNLREHKADSDQNILLAAKGGGIAFAGNLFVYVTRFAFGIILANLLGAELLGVYSLSLTITSIAGAVVLLGLNTGIARYIPIATRRKDQARLWGIIQTGIALPGILGLILAGSVFLLAEPLSYHIFNRPDLVPVLRLASIGIPLIALTTILSSITQGFKRMEYKVYAEDITLNLLKLVLSVGLLIAGLSVMGAMTAHVISLTVTMLLLFYFVHRLIPLNRPLSGAKRNSAEMLRFTLPLYLSRLLSKFSGSIETLVLGSFNIMSEVGIYTTALRLSSIGSLFHYSLQRIAVPMISDLHDRGKLGELNRVYQVMTKWGMTFNLPIFLTITIFAKPLLAIFGSDFVAGANGLVILAFGTLFNASTGVCGSIVTMTGHSKLTFANSIIYLGTNIALDLLFIPQWGGLGAALAVTLSGILINVLRLTEIFTLLRIWPYDRSFLKPLTAALISAGATFLINKQLMLLVPSLLQVAIGTLLLWSIYTLAIVLLKLSEEDRLILGRLWGRLNTWRS